MRLHAVALCALVAAAALAGAQELPPVDEVVAQATAGELTAEQLMAMFDGASEEYIRDVKNGLPHELKHHIGELILERVQHTETPADEQQEQDDYGDSYDDYEDDYSDDYAESNDPEPADEVPESEPEQEQEPEPEPGSDGEQMLHAEPPLRAGEGDGPAEGGMGGGGGSTGGVLPSMDVGEQISDLKAARQLLLYSEQEKAACQKRYDAAYNFYITDSTLGPDKVSSEVEYLKLWRQFADNVTNLDLSGLERTDLVTVFLLLKSSGISALTDQQLNEFVTAITNLETKFSRAEVCDFYDETKCGLKLYKDIRVKLASSTDEQELAHYWLTWRGLLARNSAQHYADYVRLLDTAAKQKDPEATAWSLLMYPYSHGRAANVLNQLERLWEQSISPLYEQLHEYARRRLRQVYGAAVVPQAGPIPAHLFGSLEADDWSALEPLLRPHENASLLDFHGHCQQQGVGADILKQTAAKLYTQLGLNEVGLKDLLHSRLDITSPNADNVMFLPRVLDGCHVSSRAAIGIYPTNTTLSDYVELVELFATMQQFVERGDAALADKLGFPYKSRVGYNAYGLDLAIGGARALAAISPEGLKSQLGFSLYDTSEQAMMNFQMAHALKLVPRLAASMAAVRWQADVMTGEISQDQYNSKWWEYKEKYQRISPPEQRDNSQFDAFADGTLTQPNYHIRRLVGGVAAYSVHKYHCRMYDSAATPLSECAIFDSEQLGGNIRDVLVSGNSKNLKDQLQALTGEKDLSAAALVEQTQPLSEWLVEYNKANDMEDDDGIAANSDVIAIIVGVVIAVIIVGLVIFFVVAKRRQGRQDLKDVPAREYQSVQQA